MNQRVVVTGGAGFLGAALVQRLLAEGHSVVALDNFWRGSMENLRSVMDHPHLTVVEGDVTVDDDLERCAQALGGVDLVHHLAAINGTKWFDEAAIEVIDVNINGTLVALRKAQAWGARFVLASSPEAFGENESMPLRNDDESRFPSASTHQRFSYGASKYLDEIAVQHAVRNGLDARIVRPFNAYGPTMVGDEYGQVVGMFFNAVKEQRAMRLHGDGLQTRSMTYIDDTVEGFYLAGALERGVDGTELAGRSFNIGSHEEVSIRYLAESINRTVGTMAVDMVIGGGYPGDSQRRLPDTSAANISLGWEPLVSLSDGLAKVWAQLQTGP
ncbi:MAG: SDR family NAD(P)-dependent oxidoreductase [Candidatus Poseidoniales archaeon]|nr:MAG: SDR family NAD(P)-dependent oxidoreductase [Candidatus Poseidoniales archaeon]